MITIATHQPQFLSWAGYYHKLLTTDIFGYMSYAQYTDRNYQNRCKLQNAWLTVPLRKTARDTSLQHKHPLSGWNASNGKVVKTLRQYANSSQCKYKDRIFYIVAVLESLNDSAPLSEINITLDAAVLYLICSTANLPPSKWPNLINLSKEVKGDTKTKRLVSALDVLRNGRSMCSCIGTGAYYNYYNPTELPEWVTITKVQRVLSPSVMSDSIIHVLGEVEDPYSYILDSFTWITVFDKTL